MQRIFVFGSNRQGRHGAGSALSARMNHGAIYGQAEGPQGNSYAIVTKELRPNYPVVTLNDIAKSVTKFLTYAREHKELRFDVVALGCQLAGFKVGQIAPLFKGHPRNVFLAQEFVQELERS